MVKNTALKLKKRMPKEEEKQFFLILHEEKGKVFPFYEKSLCGCVCENEMKNPFTSIIKKGCLR